MHSHMGDQPFNRLSGRCEVSCLIIIYRSRLDSWEMGSMHEHNQVRRMRCQIKSKIMDEPMRRASVQVWAVRHHIHPGLLAHRTHARPQRRASIHVWRMRCQIKSKIMDEPMPESVRSSVRSDTPDTPRAARSPHTCTSTAAGVHSSVTYARMYSSYAAPWSLTS